MVKVFLKNDYFNLTEIEKNVITDELIYDIMSSLELQPRFLGHTHRPWTVANHLWLCDYIVNFIYSTNYSISPERFSNLRKKIFLHDMHEGIIGDIPGPLKNLINENSDNFITLVEKRIDALFHNHFGIYEDKELDYIVKQVDYAALVAEINILTNNDLYDPEYFVNCESEIAWIQKFNPPLIELKEKIFKHE